MVEKAPSLVPRAGQAFGPLDLIDTCVHLFLLSTNATTRTTWG
jgi:hypothetical protein